MTPTQPLPTLAQAAAVQARINADSTYTSDPARYKVPEFWDVIDGEGDCEDYALGYRQHLLRAGFAPDALMLALCRAEGVSHCVLIVTTSDAGTVVLDCRESEPRHRWQLGYKWIAMQEGNSWREIT